MVAQKKKYRRRDRRKVRKRTVWKLSLTKTEEFDSDCPHRPPDITGYHPRDDTAPSHQSWSLYPRLFVTFCISFIETIIQFFVGWPPQD